MTILHYEECETLNQEFKLIRKKYFVLFVVIFFPTHLMLNEFEANLC